MPAADAVPDNDLPQEASIAPTKRGGFFNKKSAVAADAVPDNDLQGSVFDTGSARVSRALSAPAGQAAAAAQFGGMGMADKATTALKLGVGPALGTAASVATTAIAPEWKTAAIVGQAAAGLITPDAQHGIAVLTGQPDAAPSWNDRIRSMSINMGLSGITEVLAKGVPKGGAAVAPEFEGVNSNVRNSAQIKAALLRREVLVKQLTGDGMPEAQANQTVSNWFQRVEKDPTELDKMARVQQTAQDTHQLYQNVYNSGKQDFNQQFASIPHQDANVFSTPIAQGINGILAKAPVQARDSSVYKFLEEKSEGFDPTHTVPRDIDKQFQAQSSGDPAMMAKLRQQYLAQTPQTGPQKISLSQLRQRITESYENEPRNASEAEHSMMVQYREQLRSHFDSGMLAAGSKPEDLAKVDQIYHSFGDFATNMRNLDPRDERMGTKAADALFGESYKVPDEGVTFARYVRQADQLHPGLMSQFKQGIIDHLLKTAQQKAAGGGVMNEVRNLADIQRDIYNAAGGTKSGATFLSTVFGKGPLATPDGLAKVVGHLANPDLAARDVGQVAQAINFLRPSGATNYLLKYALLTGFGGLVLGQTVGISKLLQHPAALGVALGGFLLTGAAARTFLSHDNFVATAYANAVLSGETDAWVKFIKTSSGATGGLLSGAVNLNATQPEEESQPTVP